jgi:hypothetical protein
MKVSLSALTKKEYINTEGTLYLSLVLKTAPAFSNKIFNNSNSTIFPLINCRSAFSGIIFAIKPFTNTGIELSTSYFSTGANSTTTID